MSGFIPKFRIPLAAVTTFAVAALGGWDKALQGLLVFMVLDLLAGMILAIKQKRFLSILAVSGFSRKVGYLLVVAAAQAIDVYLLTDAQTPWARTATAAWFAWSELNSFAANLALYGVKLPTFISDYLQREIASKESKGVAQYGGEAGVRDGSPTPGVTPVHSGDTR